MKHYAVSKKNLILAAILVPLLVVGTFIAGMKVGEYNEVQRSIEPMNSEIRLVQEHTAEAVTDMFMNIPEVREAMNSTKGNIYSCRINWWNFDRQFELVRFKENNYHESWYELAR